MVSSEFSNPALCSVDFIFQTCKNFEEIVFEAKLQQLLSQALPKTANASYFYS